MDPTTQLAILFTSIKYDVIISIFITYLIYVLHSIAKRFVENEVEYRMFASNKNLGKGVKVRLNGEDGVITHYDRRFIYVKVVGGHECIVPISRWRNYSWQIKDFYAEMYKKIE